MTDNTSITHIAIDGTLVPVMAADVQFSDLARFQPKILFGDPSKDDNDLLSSWQMGDFTGGNGVVDLKEGTDQNRYAMSTIYTRFPYMLSRPPYVNSNDPTYTGTGDKMVLGEFWGITSNQFYLVYMAGLEVRRGLIDATIPDNELSTIYATPSSGSLANLPVSKGQAFQGTFTEERFFIPRGNNGYSFITETSVAPTNFASPKFANFAVWDNKLIGITTGGRMYWSLDGTTFTAYDLTFQLSKSYRIRNLINFFDRRDEPALFVITDRDIWQFDPSGPELFRIDNGWPTHPHHGLASAVYNGQLYVSVGMLVMRYSGGAWMPVGLDRDDGLYAEYGGGSARIVDMVSGWNSLYALVQASGGSAVYGSKSAIYEFTGTGWHCIWNQDTAIPANDQNHATASTTALTVNYLTLTQSGGGQTLVFGTGGSDDKLYFMPLSLSFANPRVGMLTASGKVNPVDDGNYYYLETGEFDADMFGYIKVANALQFVLEEPVAIAPANRDTVRFLYRIDRGTWVLAYSAAGAPGRYAQLLGTPDARGIYPGLQFDRIQWRVEMRNASPDPTKAMLITNIAMSFVKTVNSNNAFQVRIPITEVGNGDDLDGAGLANFLDTLIESRKFVEMKVGARTYRVMMTQNGGTIRGGTQGENGFGTRSVAFVEIPTSF